MKKLHLTGSWKIFAPREEVYKIISYFEYYPPNTVTEDDKVLLYIPVIDNR